MPHCRSRHRHAQIPLRLRRDRRPSQDRARGLRGARDLRPSETEGRGRVCHSHGDQPQLGDQPLGAHHVPQPGHVQDQDRIRRHQGQAGSDDTAHVVQMPRRGPLEDIPQGCRDLRRLHRKQSHPAWRPSGELVRDHRQRLHHGRRRNQGIRRIRHGHDSREQRIPQLFRSPEVRSDKTCDPPRRREACPRRYRRRRPHVHLVFHSAGGGIVARIPEILGGMHGLGRSRRFDGRQDVVREGHGPDAGRRRGLEGRDSGHAVQSPDDVRPRVSVVSVQRDAQREDGARTAAGQARRGRCRHPAFGGRDAGPRRPDNHDLQERGPRRQAGQDRKGVRHSRPLRLGHRPGRRRARRD